MPSKSSIYRILDLHDLVNMLESNELRLRQAIKMTDKNEAIGFYFGLLTSSFYIEGDEKGMRDSLLSIQSSTYITSWSHVDEDIALWSLYSQNYNGVQIEADFKQLEVIFQKYFLDNIYSMAYNLTPNDPRVLIREQQFGNVGYSNLQDDYTKYTILRKEYAELCFENYERDNFNDITANWRAEKFSKFDHSRRYLIKDNRYKHEKEVRGILQICKRDERTPEEYEAHPMAGLDSPTKLMPPQECQENIYIPLPKGFIKSIKLDSRLPNWKLKAARKILNKYGIEIGVSSAFSPQYDKGGWF